MVTVFLLSYFISCMFNEIFGMTIETILLCYIADEEMFSAADRYAEGALQESISSTSKAAASNKIHADNDESSKHTGDDDRHVASAALHADSGPVLL